MKQMVPGGKCLHVALELCLRLEILLAVVVLRAFVLVLIRTVVHPLVNQAILLVMTLDVLVQNVFRRVPLTAYLAEPAVWFFRLMVARHMERERLGVCELFAAQIAELVGMEDPNVSRCQREQIEAKV